MIKQSRRSIATTFFAIAAILIIVVQFGLIAALTAELGRQDRARVWDTKLIYSCYNNQIQPCDDEHVTAWNRQNPDKAITEEFLRKR